MSQFNIFWKNYARIIISLFVGCSLIVCSKGFSSNALHPKTQDEYLHPPKYWPEAKYVRLVSLGFNNFAANILWFQVNSYFGKQLREGKDFLWLEQMCEIVSSLDPKKKYVFHFCANMISWVVNEPEKSTHILSKAIKYHPDDWIFFHQRAFNYWFFLENPKLAALDLNRASQLEGAPPFLTSQAAKLLLNSNDPETAISFLKDSIHSTKDNNVKKVLKEKLLSALLTKDIYTLKHAAQKFFERYGRDLEKIEDLLSARMITNLPKDPYGGTYYYDREAKEFRSTSNKPLLKFQGKTFKERAKMKKIKVPSSAS